MVFVTYGVLFQIVGVWFPKIFGILSASGVATGSFGWSGIEVQVYCNAGSTPFIIRTNR